MTQVTQRFNVTIPDDNGYKTQPQMMYRVTDHLAQDLGNTAELESTDGKLSQGPTGDYTLIARSVEAAVRAPAILQRHYGFKVEKAPQA